MLSTFYFKFKLNAPAAMLLLAILSLSSFSASAQQGEKEMYVDYDELTASVLRNLKAAQAKVHFPGSAQLRKETLALPAGAKAVISSMPKAGKKEMSGAEIAEARKNGVLMIFKYFKASPGSPERIQFHATATTLTQDGICLSNWHVFMGFIQPEMHLPATDSLTFAVSLKGDIYPIERLLAYSETGDAAIFKINTGKDRLEAIPLGDELAVGETVHALTNPENYLYYYSKGVVARNTANHKAGPMADRMEITADYAKGSSGGPILDDRGNLAGMVSTTHSFYANDRQQSNLQMVIKTTIPVRSIRRLIQLQ